MRTLAKVPKVTKVQRVKTKNNLYRMIKNKRAASTIEDNVYRLSKGSPKVYYDYTTKIMIMIIPKKHQRR